MHAPQQKIVLLNVQVNTHDPKFFTCHPRQKLQMLGNALASLNSDIQTNHQNTAPQKIRGILVAPEYFFAPSMKPHEVRQYPESTARYIERELVKFSQQYPHILIIPGTIAWHKKLFNRLERPTHEEYETYGNKCTKLNATMKKSPAEYIADKRSRGVFTDDIPPQIIESKFFKYLGKQHDRRQLMHSRELILRIMSPKKDHFTRSNPASDPHTKYFTLAGSKSTPYPDVYVSRNTALFYLGGKRVYKYHKSSDFNEVKDPGLNVFIHGNTKPIIQIEGITFGIEICFDHGFDYTQRGKLKEFIQDSFNNNIFMANPNLERDGKPVDIHLILSASVQNYDKNFCMNRDGGYLIHSSAAPQNNCFLISGQPQKIQLIASRYSSLNLAQTPTPPFYPTQPSLNTKLTNTNMVMPRHLDPPPRPETNLTRRRANSMSDQFPSMFVQPPQSDPLQPRPTPTTTRSRRGSDSREHPFFSNPTGNPGIAPRAEASRPVGKSEKSQNFFKK
jgi:hypothetical protein